MIQRNRLFSISLKVLLPLIIAITPVVAYAANDGRNPTPDAITVVSKDSISESMDVLGTNIPAADFVLTSSIDKLPENKGDQFNITFKIENTSDRYVLNNVVLNSRYLTDGKNGTSFTRLKSLYPKAYLYAAKSFTYNGTVEPVDLLKSITATSTMNKDGWPDEGEKEVLLVIKNLKTKNHTVVESPAKLVGPGIQSTTAHVVSMGAYKTTTRFGITAAFDRCPTAAGDQLNLSFTVQNGELDSTYRLRGTSEPVVIRGIEAPFHEFGKKNTSFVSLSSNILTAPGQDEDSLVLHTFRAVGNSNYTTWTMPYTYKGKEDLLEVLKEVKVTSSLDDARVGNAAGADLNLVRTGPDALPDLCGKTEPAPSTTSQPSETVPPQPVTTAPPTQPAGPEVTVSRTLLTGTATFEYVVTNNGSSTLSDIQILDNEVSTASFNQVTVIKTLGANQKVTVKADKLTMAQNGFDCQIWYHPAGSPTGVGVPCAKDASTPAAPAASSQTSTGGTGSAAFVRIK